MHLLSGVVHAAQGIFVIFNDVITLDEQAGLMAGVYLVFALIAVVAARWSFTRKPAVGISHGVEATCMSQPSARK